MNSKNYYLLLKSSCIRWISCKFYGGSRKLKTEKVNDDDLGNKYEET